MLEDILMYQAVENYKPEVKLTGKEIENALSNKWTKWLTEVDKINWFLLSEGNALKFIKQKIL